MKILLFTARFHNYSVFAFSVFLALSQNTHFFYRGILSVIDVLVVLFCVCVCGNTGLVFDHLDRNLNEAGLLCFFQLWVQSGPVE